VSDTGPLDLLFLIRWGGMLLVIIEGLYTELEYTVHVYISVSPESITNVMSPRVVNNIVES